MEEGKEEEEEGVGEETGGFDETFSGSEVVVPFELLLSLLELLEVLISWGWSGWERERWAPRPEETGREEEEMIGWAGSKSEEGDLTREEGEWWGEEGDWGGEERVALRWLATSKRDNSDLVLDL